MSRREPDLSAAHSWALSLVNRGHDETFIARTVIRDRTIVEMVVTDGKPKAEATALRVARNAIAYATANPVEEWRSQVPAKVAAHREQADARPWTGRTGPTDRRVMETHYLTMTM